MPYICLDVETNGIGSFRYGTQRIIQRHTPKKTHKKESQISPQATANIKALKKTVTTKRT